MMDKKILAELKDNLLAQNMPGGFFIYEATEEGKLLYANEELYTIFGCSDEAEFAALTGKTFKGMVFVEDRARVQAEIHAQVAANNGKYDKVTYRIVDKEQNIRWVADFGHLVEHTQLGKVYTVLLVDMTQEKYDQQRLSLMMEMDRLRTIFAIVRLVDVNDNLVYDFDATGKLIPSEEYCFETWGKSKRCENCVSTKAYGCNDQMSKFEFMDGDPYYVVSRRVELQGKSYIMEMVTKIEDAALFSVFGKKNFAEKLEKYNRQIYLDALTGAYNRHYLDEQLSKLDSLSALVLFDIDNFKKINDTFGHLAGDMVLRDVAMAVNSCIRKSDALVRYGGDEFLVAFTGFTQAILPAKMEQMRAAVEKLTWEGHPEVHVTISLGGTYASAFTTDTFNKIDCLLYKAKVTRNAICTEY